MFLHFFCPAPKCPAANAIVVQDAVSHTQNSRYLLICCNKWTVSKLDFQHLNIKHNQCYCSTWPLNIGSISASSPYCRRKHEKYSWNINNAATILTSRTSWCDLASLNQKKLKKYYTNLYFWIFQLSKVVLKLQLSTKQAVGITQKQGRNPTAPQQPASTNKIVTYRYSKQTVLHTVLNSYGKS